MSLKFRSRNYWKGFNILIKEQKNVSFNLNFNFSFDYRYCNVTEVARGFPTYGGVIATLPLVSKKIKSIELLNNSILLYW